MIDRPVAESTNHILGGLGMQVGLSVATQVAVNLFEKMLGNSYSKANFKRYTELKRVYAKILGRDAPHFWKLDDKNRPTFQMGNYKWSDYVRELSEGKETSGEYSTQSSSIAKHLSTYLTERRKRWFGSGDPGDLLELYMSEWMHFALNELPTFKFDDPAVKKIKARLKYLVKIQKHEALFKGSFIGRRKNKIDTMEAVRQELLECKRRAEKQASRECAREKFKICRDSTTDLLMASLNSIYYARATPVYNEAFIPRTFIDPAKVFITKNAQKLYPEVKSSHTGTMLYELLMMSGLEAFGITNLVRDQPFKAQYFNEDFSSKSIDWSSAKHDLPKWIEKEEAPRYLSETQQMAESVLRIAKLKGLVEEVYDLTGQLGDLWAYGDKRGRLSLEGLLFLLEKELALFYDRYEKLYQYQDTLRQSYIIARAVNPNDAASANFNLVDDQREEVEKFYGRIKAAINDLRVKLGEFSEEDVKRIDERKKLFYRSVAGHVKRYYPENYHRFQLLEQPLSQEEAAAAFGLENPLMDLADSPQGSSMTWIEKFFPGESFAQWRKKYYSRHKNEYQILANLLLQFEDQINAAGPRDESAGLERALQSQLEQMRFKALAERPSWKLGWSSLALGWPFKRNVNKNIQIILNEFSLLSTDIKRSFDEEKNKQGVYKLEPVVPRAELLSQKQIRAVFHYKNNKNTIFNKKPKLDESHLEEKQCDKNRFTLDR